MVGEGQRTGGCSPRLLVQHLTWPLLPEVHRRGVTQLYLGAYKEHQLQVSEAEAGGQGGAAPSPKPEPSCLLPLPAQCVKSRWGTSCWSCSLLTP